MHKLSQPAPPTSWHDCLKNIRQTIPIEAGKLETARWDAFRNEHQDVYTDVRDTLEDNQHGLCAYCEIKVSKVNRQIEHILPKKDSNPETDLTFAFSNFVLCCNGGTVPFCKDKGAFDNAPNIAMNISCGAKKGDKKPCLNPYDLPDYPLFYAHPDSNDKKLFFSPNEKSCEKSAISAELVRNTIHLLSLNCPRLSRVRYEVWEEINGEIDEIYDDQTLSDDERNEEFKLLIKKHLSPEVQFYTTALLCVCHQLPDLVPHS